MEIGNWPSAGYMNDLYPELRRLGLESNIAELEAFGFTVLLPEKVNAPGLHQRALEVALRVAEERAGARIDFETGKSHMHMVNPLGQYMRFMLWQDPVFEKLLLNPAMLGIVTWLLGPMAILSLCNVIIRGPGENSAALHTDDSYRSVPVHPVNVNAVNATFLLTDYTKDGGSLGMVPGSHKFRREPTPPEIAAFTEMMVPVEAPAGSFVIWGDSVWHGAFPRRRPGLRANMFFNFFRHHMQQQEPYRDTCTQEALDRNPRRFAVLMDQFGVYPFREEDVDFDRRAEREKYVSLFDNEPTRGSIRLRSRLPRRTIPSIAQPTASPYAARLDDQTAQRLLSEGMQGVPTKF